jgi:hypothetical protein
MGKHMETHHFDWFTFIFLIFGTCVIASFTLCIIVYRKYPPLKAKSLSNLACLSMAGIIHMWSVFIVNEHIQPFKMIHSLNCTFWSFMMQFCFGLGIWFPCIYYRMGKYGKIFDEKAFKKHTLLWKDIAMTIGIVPIWIITILVWFTKGCQYDTTLQTCVTRITWEIAALSWLLANGLIFAMCVKRLVGSVDNSFFNERRSLMAIGFCGCLITLIDSIILFTGKVNTEYGRNIYTISIVCLHLFCVPRIAGFTLFKATNNDTAYSAQYKNSLGSFFPVVEIDSVLAFKKQEIYYRDFLIYCSCQSHEKAPEVVEGSSLYDAPVTTKMIGTICGCLSEIIKFRSLYNIISIKMREDICDSITSNYLISNGPKFIPLEVTTETLLKGHTISMWIFDSVEDYLLKKIGSIYFATYMRDQFPIVAKDQIRQVELVGELAKENLLDNIERRRILGLDRQHV